MKTTVLLFVLFLIETTFLNAQIVDWAKRMGGTGNEYGTSLAIDASGNTYTIGYFSGTADFDPGIGTHNLTSVDGNDIFISKLNSLGDYVWVKRFGGIGDGFGYSIKLDDSGNLFATGYFSGTTDFDPGSGVNNITSSGLTDIFIAKLDTAGNFMWSKTIGGSGNEYCFSLVLDNSCNLYLTGGYNGTVDFDPGAGVLNLTSAGSSDIFILKIDAAGNFVWAKSMGGTGEDEGHSIALDELGKVYTTGHFSGTADFDPGFGTDNLVSAGLSDIFISKIDISGNHVFAKRIGGANYDVGQSIASDSSGNIYTAGVFKGNTDFDPGIGTFNINSLGLSDIYILKLDISGNFHWVKRIGGTQDDICSSIALDISGNVYASGWYSGVVDFDPGPGNSNITATGFVDAFISKLDSQGNYIWAQTFGGTNLVYAYSVVLDDLSNIYTTGYFYGIIDFDPGPGIINLTAAGGDGDVFVNKINQKGIFGRVFNDFNQNCYLDNNEAGIPNRSILINPGNIITQTNIAGYWTIDSLPAGTYTISVDPSGPWIATCPVSQSFNISIPDGLTNAPSFGLVSTSPCASPEVSIFMPFIRPCFENQMVIVSACNQSFATGIINNGFVDVELDSLLILQSANLAFTSLGNNVFRFQIGTLFPNHCQNITLYCKVNCNAVLGQTLCMQANIFPVDTCVLDTVPYPFPGNFTPCNSPWDHSSLQVDGYCLNDSVYFIITNTGQLGNGDMDCFSPVRIYIDGVCTILDSIQLVGGDTAMFVFAGEGYTWRLEADQHPLHPGNSHPNKTIEACGDSSNWSPGLVVILPADDADPFVDIYCGVVTGSYDPNDKIGYPLGVTTENYIMPNQQIQYVIRFQNTGTDTAFTVIIRDTLDTNLDIFSVVPGASSHEYEFKMYGPRILEWTFNNILLPDSNHHESESHGFVSFTVNQNNSLSNNTIIYNSADIYFDYNLPIKTNQTKHTVNDMIQTVLFVSQTPSKSMNQISIFPNPASEKIHVICTENINTSVQISIYSINGKELNRIVSRNNENEINVSCLEQGIYFLKILGNNTNETRKVLIVR